MEEANQSTLTMKITFLLYTNPRSKQRRKLITCCVQIHKKECIKSTAWNVSSISRPGNAHMTTTKKIQALALSIKAIQVCSHCTCKISQLTGPLRVGLTL